MKALALAVGVVLLVVAGALVLAVALVVTPGVSVPVADGDTWLGLGILLSGGLAVAGMADLLLIMGLRRTPARTRSAAAAPAAARTKFRTKAMTFLPASGPRLGLGSVRTARKPPLWKVLLGAVALIALGVGAPFAIELGFAAATPASSDFRSDSVGTYMLANLRGRLLDVTPRDLHDHPDRYALELVKLHGVVARTLHVDSRLGGLQGSSQFLAFPADDPGAAVLLNDETSYVSPICADQYQGCLRFLGDRMDTTGTGGERTYDNIEGRWLPVRRFPLLRLREQPHEQYALWVAITNKG
jgi:hypothetical protein